MTRRLFLKTAIFLVSVAALLISGCRPQPAKPGRRDAWIVVVGIDVTGSHALRDMAPAILSRMFESNARPGDTWVIRKIDNASYSDRANILTITLPTVEEEPENPFDVETHAAYQQSISNFEMARSEVLKKIKSLRMHPVRGTDVWGFIAKASELGATHIVIFSDLGDTLRLQSSQRLNGAKVYIFVQSGRDPRLAHRRRQQWQQWLSEMGASKVIFCDYHGVPPKL